MSPFRVSRSLSGLHLLGWNERALRVHPEALTKDDAFRSSSEAEQARLADFGGAKQKRFIRLIFGI